MILKALRGENLPIYGTGLQVRDWLYVEDHAEALIRIIQEGLVGESYNIGASCEKTNLQVVEEICKILDETQFSRPGNITSFKELISFVDDRPGHDQRYAINSDKIKKELGWQADENFESGLKKTIDWYAKRADKILYQAERIGKNKE
jgi:dTDP-glucose 4,6-dehydratase